MSLLDVYAVAPSLVARAVLFKGTLSTMLLDAHLHVAAALATVLETCVRSLTRDGIGEPSWCLILPRYVI